MELDTFLTTFLPAPVNGSSGGSASATPPAERLGAVYAARMDPRWEIDGKCMGNLAGASSGSTKRGGIR